MPRPICPRTLLASALSDLQHLERELNDGGDGELTGIALPSPRKLMKNLGRNLRKSYVYLRLFQIPPHLPRNQMDPLLLPLFFLVFFDVSTSVVACRMNVIIESSKKNKQTNNSNLRFQRLFLRIIIFYFLLFFFFFAFIACFAFAFFLLDNLPQQERNSVKVSRSVL